MNKAYRPIHGGHPTPYKQYAIVETSNEIRESKYFCVDLDPRAKERVLFIKKDPQFEKVMNVLAPNGIEEGISADGIMNAMESGMMTEC